jgi:hypothetical protein
VSYVDLRISLSIIAGVGGYEMGRFGESIHDYPNRIELAEHDWSAHDEIHAYIIPLLF